MPSAQPLVELMETPLFGTSPVLDAVNALASAGTEQRGAVFTRPEVVEFILDLTGYTTDQPLMAWRLLEPAFGDGDFLMLAIDRLLKVWERSGRPDAVTRLRESIRAVELHRDSHASTSAKVVARLIEAGMDSAEAETLAEGWLVFGDFLLAPLEGSFDVVVGNPPYLRQEMIAEALMNEYRARYRTIYDRADIYVPFIERSLTHLTDGGRLGFICADRWMKNRYGGPLRKMVAEGFRLKVYVDMVDTPAFHSEVIAYPAITVIAREAPGPTRVAYRPRIERQALTGLADSLLSSDALDPASGVSEVADVAVGSEPWILESFSRVAIVRRLEAAFPTLAEAGCVVGIGVATGADKAFIGPFDGLDVEEDRKLPLVMTRDIDQGEVRWRGLGVVNPFGPDGRLVDLADYPQLRGHLQRHRELIDKRHVAQKSPANWYRTIDRIYPEIAAKPKLLIPDIKGEANVVYEPGGLYPHHNLYFMTSEVWELLALQAVLLSGIARLFIEAYSTKMRGGYLRFQAQYLRRIRLPLWSEVPGELRKRLTDAAESRDVVACDRAAFELYGLSDDERATLARVGV